MFDGRALIGMVHAGALPGAPGARESVRALAARAAAEARMLRDAGFDGVIVENMHDRPYVNGPHGPETVAAMACVVGAVRGAVDVPLGVQVLSRGEREALSIAHACGAEFIRCENFAYAQVADEGLMAEAAAGPLLRLRASIGARGVRVMCDVKKKHASHAITADLPLAEAVRGAEFFGADGVIVSGARTGAPTDPEDAREARGATGLPVWVGSGVTPARAGALLAHADALIVGSWIKRGGDWRRAVDPARCRAMVKAFRAAARAVEGRTGGGRRARRGGG